MDILHFNLNHKLLSIFQTGNVILDLLIPIIIIKLISLFDLDYKKYFNKLKKYFLNINDKYHSEVFYEYRKNNLSDNVKGILYYATRNNNLLINKFVESREYKFCHKKNDDIERLIYLPKENEIYQIYDDIYIKLGSKEKKVEGGNIEIFHEYTNLCIYSKNKSGNELKKKIEEWKNEYINDLDLTELSHPSIFKLNYNAKKKETNICKINFNSNTTFKNLFFDQKEHLLQCLLNFLKNKQKYDKIGIPYTIGFLLYGEPGCGKTSFIKAILNFLNEYKNRKVHGIYVNLHDGFDIDELEDIMLTEKVGDYKIKTDEKIYIFEDIDCMGDLVKDRELKKKNKKIKYTGHRKKNKCEQFDSDNSESDTINLNQLKSALGNINSDNNDNENNLSKLLNILDGLIETPGRIIIMTTNKLELLDKALIRPGRIDFKINFTKCSKKMAIDIINNFYDSNIDDIFYNDYTISPAELKQYCKENNDANDLLLFLKNFHNI